MIAPGIIFLLGVSGLAIFPISIAQGETGSSQPSSSVVPTQLTGYSLTGSLPSSTPVYVTVGIPLRTLQTLQYLTQQISTPGSPMYDHFLTQAQIEQEFLPTGEYEQALSFLQLHGFSIVLSSLDSIIVAQGTASQVSQSLGVSLNVYSNGSESYYSASGVSVLQGVYLYSSNVTSIILAHPTSLVTESTISALKSASPAQSNQTAPIEAYPLTDLRSAYNVSSLISRGITGRGYTAGVLDFYGDPYIAQQLQYFDEVYGVPSSSLQIIPIGPYDPSLGPVTGWDGEISLDVESVHAMAPGAAIDLYVGNGALPIAAAIAQVVQDDQVNDLSQSFGIPEALISQLGASGLDLNVILSDQYYMLGSAEGITFISSTGDRAGSGASGGPEGTPSYPSTSPYVVAVGGTTTYLDYQGSTVVSSSQTAWSNYGFTPDGANYGGGTGGVSILEPKPWYQSNISTPSGFADGRMVPDVSLNANAYPGVEVIFPGNVTEITGGTSESSPLLAGLLTLMMQSSRSSLGLINPSLYDLGQSGSLNSKVYTPITFGYTIPWVASSGYNLVTGLGAPNIGEMASVGLDGAATRTLNVNVTLFPGEPPSFEVLGGQELYIGAKVTSGSSAVVTGAFTAELETVQGAVAGTSLNYNSTAKEWTGYLIIPTSASGLSYLTVKGSSGGVSGIGFAELFAGYVATYFSPGTASDFSPLPYSAEFGIPLAVNITTLSGSVVDTGAYSVTFSSYSIASNTYSPFSNVSLSFGPSPYGLMWVGVANGAYPDGPMLISTNNGAYGYLPFIEGVDLEGSFVETSVLAEPGVVAPGQSVFVLASLFAPLNTPPVISEETGSPVAYDIETGSNVTATLVSPSGAIVLTSHMYENDFLTSSLAIQGYFDIPLSAEPGLYTLILNSTFDSFTLGKSVNGSYFAQFYVSPLASVPSISITPSLLFQGQSATVSAKIDYINGTSVKYGMYMATVYPTGLQNDYNALTETIQVPLWYDVSTGLWSGNMTLPSAYNGGGTVFIDPGALYLNGPYDVFVTGLSADGVPSTTDISAQQGFQIQPYLLISGQAMSSLPQTSGLALQGDTITGSASLSNDLFLGSNTVQGGSVTIMDSQINGTLNIKNAQVTLVGVTGGTIVAQNSKVTLDQSSIDSLQLESSQVSLNQSSYQQVTPSLPSITVQSPAAGQNFNGTSGSFTVNGQDVSSVSAYLDGVLLSTSQSGTSYSFQLASPLQDGVHQLQVVATQQDGLSTSSSVYFTTNAQLTAANNSINSISTQQVSASSTISSLNSQLSSANATINGLGSKLDSANTSITNLTYGLYALGALAVIAVGLGVVAVSRKNSPPPTPASSPTPPS